MKHLKIKLAALTTLCFALMLIVLAEVHYSNAKFAASQSEGTDQTATRQD